ncbi:unnamed protein product [Mycena citricolor]|uniref:Uncharacterized protein n=1 Tax=Mycena citricolor TaxID=2018698 RepID=A0AAD2JV22_9AGAR|nr:unnamed protein product [Mycena citricolor]CAK5275107.1 unnamed protein product [Mycena citricolor]
MESLTTAELRWKVPARARCAPIASPEKHLEDAAEDSRHVGGASGRLQSGAGIQVSEVHKNFLPRQPPPPLLPYPPRLHGPRLNHIQVVGSNPSMTRHCHLGTQGACGSCRRTVGVIVACGVCDAPDWWPSCGRGGGKKQSNEGESDPLSDFFPNT